LNIIKNTLKRPLQIAKPLLRPYFRPYFRLRDCAKTYLYYHNYGLPRSKNFDLDSARDTTLRFVNSMKIAFCSFKYSYSTSKPTLYCSAYACCLYSLYGKTNLLSDNEKQWAKYFDSFQDPQDGFKKDSVIMQRYVHEW